MTLEDLRDEIGRDFRRLEDKIDGVAGLVTEIRVEASAVKAKADAAEVACAARAGSASARIGKVEKLLGTIGLAIAGATGWLVWDRTTGK